MNQNSLSGSAHPAGVQSGEIERARTLIANVAASCNLAYTVNLTDDSFRQLRMDDGIKGKGRVFSRFSEALGYFVDEIVHPRERDAMRKEVDFATLRRKSSELGSYDIEYRALINGATIWHVMNVTALDGDEIAIGFAVKDLELVMAHIEQKRYEENFAMFVVDLDTEMLRVLKNDGPYRALKVGDSVPCVEAIRRFAAVHEGEARDILLRIADLGFVRRELASEDKRACSYRSIASGDARWIDLTSFVVLRHADGTPAMFTLGFSYSDTLSAGRQEVQRRIRIILSQDISPDSAIDEILALAGEFHGADRAWVFEFSGDGRSLSNTYEWHREGIAPAIDQLKEIPRGELESWMTEFRRQGVYRLESVEGAGLSPLCEKLLGLLGVERIVAVPLLKGGTIVGFIGVDNPTRAGKDTKVLSTLAAVAYSEILKRQEYAVSRAQLENALRMAESASRSKSAFLFNMSHDIRTPMNAILGFTEIAMKNLDNRAKLADCIHKAREAGELLLSLINGVLDMSRVEAGKATVEESVGDVLYSFAGIQSTMLELARAKGITLTFEFGEITDRYVYVDYDRCNRVFVNIISNAIKYSRPDGWVKVRCEQAGANAGGVAAYRYIFEDNGIGMSEEFQEHLFEQFARERNSTTSGIQGTGLGMALCKAFVELMGGTIKCRSRQGVGTTFVVELPFRVQDKAEYIDPDTGEVRSATVGPSDKSECDRSLFMGRRVLLVEDNELNREVALYILDEMGFVVDTAVNGQEAVEKVTGQRSKVKGQTEDNNHCLTSDLQPLTYDLILMDIQMPVMDGYAATRAIRAWEQSGNQTIEQSNNSHIPIIALSANAFAEDRAASLRAGMDAHVAKPIKVPELMSTLAQFL